MYCYKRLVLSSGSLRLELFFLFLLMALKVEFSMEVEFFKNFFYLRILSFFFKSKFIIPASHLHLVRRVNQEVCTHSDVCNYFFVDISTYKLFFEKRTRLPKRATIIV